MGVKINHESDSTRSRFYNIILLNGFGGTAAFISFVKVGEVFNHLTVSKALGLNLSVRRRIMSIQILSTSVCPININLKLLELQKTVVILCVENYFIILR